MSFTSFPIQTNPFASYAATLTGTLSFGTAHLSSNGVQLNGNLSFSGTQTASQAWIWQNGNLISGTAAAPVSGIIAPAQIYIASDTVDTTTSGPGGLSGLMVLDAPASGHTGGRNAIFGYTAVVGSPTTLSASGYVGVQAECRVNSNLTGTTGVYTNYKGGIFGSSSFAWAQSGATFVGSVNGYEFDIEVDSGASCADKYGVRIVKTGNDANRGTYDDCAININDQDATTATWQYGLSFGAYAHKWPFGTDSTLIVAQVRQSGASANSVALYGCDFSNVTFTTGGAPYLAPLITPSSSSATGKQGSICWDSGFIYICTATNTWKRAALSAF